MRVLSIAIGFVANVSCVWLALSIPHERNMKSSDPGPATKTPGQDVPASKRSLWNFNSMINCGTDRNSLHYRGYGCWCGLGGYGRPVDDIDRWAAPASSYSWWQCYGKCREELCKCDAAAVKCFARSEYHDQYKYYSNTKHCKRHETPANYKAGHAR